MENTNIFYLFSTIQNFYHFKQRETKKKKEQKAETHKFTELFTVFYDAKKKKKEIRCEFYKYFT